jgi:hypothetical protein
MELNFALYFKNSKDFNFDTEVNWPDYLLYKKWWRGRSKYKKLNSTVLIDWWTLKEY